MSLNPLDCAFCSIEKEEVAEKDCVRLVHRPPGAHGDTSDSVPVKLQRAQRTVQLPDGEPAELFLRYTTFTTVRRWDQQQDLCTRECLMFN